MSGTQRSTPSLSLDPFPLDITTERTPRPPNSALPLHYPSTGRRYTYMAARGPTMDYSTPPSTVHYTTTTGTRLPTSSNKSSSLGRVSPPPSITCLSSIHLRMLRLRIWTSTMCVPLSSTFFFLPLLTRRLADRLPGANSGRIPSTQTRRYPQSLSMVSLLCLEYQSTGSFQLRRR